MPTTLTKPVTRRIGDLVVRLTDKGLEVRRHRQRRPPLKLAWEVFEQQVDVPATRKAAFERPLPRGWLPKPGEKVFVAIVPGTLCACVSTGQVIQIIEAVPEPIVRVRLNSGRGCTEEQLYLSNVRPRRVAFGEGVNKE